jgi:acetolactate synthase-1/3 small subunit
MQHILVALVEDKPGVTNRMSSIFRRRGFNIKSFVGNTTELPGVSRITIVMESDKHDAERLMTYLHRLVDVIRVEDVTDMPVVNRDMALIKVRMNNTNRAEIMHLVDVFRARVVDISNDALVIEITGTEDKIDGFIELLRPFQIIEMVGTGLVSLTRGSAALGGENGNGVHSTQQDMEPR